MSSELPKAVWELQVYDSCIEHDQLSQLVLGWGLANYRFDRYRDKAKTPLNQLKYPQTISVSRLNGLLTGTYLCRDLINLPSNHLTPAELEKAARQLAKTQQATFTSHKGDQLAEAFPAIHTVGRAAETGPRLIDLRWSVFACRSVFISTSRSYCLSSFFRARAGYFYQDCAVGVM